MSLRAYRTFQAIILAGSGLFFLNLIWSGRLVFYSSQRFVFLALLSGLALLALAQGVLNGRPRPDEKGNGQLEEATNQVENENVHGSTFGRWANLLLVIIPIILGTVVQARPLGTSTLPTRGVSFSAVLSDVQSTVASALSLPPADRTILDWIRALKSVNDPSTLAGQPVDLIGFVYHDPRFDKNEFVVVRFATTCCVVDAVALGMVVEWPKSSELADNGWVRIQGTFQATLMGGNRLPSIQAITIEMIPEPDQPFLSS